MLRVELLLDPPIEAQCADFLHVAGAGAEGETVQGVEDLLISGLLSKGFLSLRRDCGEKGKDNGGQKTHNSPGEAFGRLDCGD